jgi:phosphoribosyl 1,2-cyclic phosphodiesterase
MQIAFHGVRGSIPAPGPETNRYGGNTSCVSVRSRAGGLLILDAGTGIISLGRQLKAAEFGQGHGVAAVLISHAHWDHIQGFPFFAPVFVGGNRFTIYGPGRSSAMLEGILEGQMNPHFSPLYTMRNLGAQIELRALDPALCEPRQESGVALSWHLNPHGSTSALAYRLEEDGHALVYAADAGYPPNEIPGEAIAFYRGADVLIHDCTYSPEDRAARITRGFSSVHEAATAAVRAGVKHLVMTHYDQDYSDEMVDALSERTRRFLDEQGGREIALTAAREGMTLEI